MAGQLRARLLPLLVIVALAASCGGGGDDGVTAGSGDRDGASEASATLGIITTNIETALGKRAFAEASEGQQLGVGDRVRTDETGFAEITYQDGSWQRVENRATLTVLALSARGSVNRVRTGVDVGRTWNRVQELDDPEDEYEVQTPVGTAAVRGTVFATDCASEEQCTFTVLEGTVRVRPVDGDPVDLQAGESLEVTDGEAPGAPTPADPDDPWIAKNQTLDAERDGGATPADDDAVGLRACDYFAPEEAEYLLTQSDNGDHAGPATEDDSGNGGPGSISSRCAWNRDDGAFIQLEISLVSNSADGCESRGSGSEPLPGVGDAAWWHPDDFRVTARLGRYCLSLERMGGIAETGRGRDAFADATQRILTRIDPGDPDLNPQPRNMTGGMEQSPTSVVMGM